MVKLEDVKKVLHYQNTLRIAELVRQLKSKCPKITEEQLFSIFEDDYRPEIIREGIERAKHFISIKKRK